MKVCMKCKRAFEDEKKVCDFCGEPLIEIRETDEVKKERIKKNPMVFAVAGIAIALVAGLGIGSLTMKQLVTGKNEKSAVQSVEIDEENVLGEVKKEKGVSIEDEEEETDEDEVPEIKVGETWTVDGLWKVTINSVTETEERNSYDDRNPEAVYIVDYTYENLGYKDEYSKGLGFDLDGVYSQIVDSDKEMGYSYYVYVLSKLTSPDYVPVGARMTAQVAIGVNHKGTFSILYEGRVEDRENLYDSKIYRVKFICEVKE